MGQSRSSLPIRSLTEVARYLGISAPSFDCQVLEATCQSRLVRDGSLFVALPGAQRHGAEFAQDAQSKGACAILTDEVGAKLAKTQAISIPVMIVADVRSEMGPLAAWLNDLPSSKLFLAGITGTNGKTTTTYLLEQIWRVSNRKTGLIGTVGIKIGDQVLPATHTTPESDQLQLLLAQMVESEVSNVAMEVSSHALVQGRVRGAKFSAVGFTNLTQDHLDYHGDMETYFRAKRSLFTHELADTAYVITDGAYGRRLYDEIEISKVSLSIAERADWYYERIEESSTGFSLAIRGSGGVLIEGQTRLIGRHNLENLILAVAIASDSGVDPLVIASSLPKLTGAPGRLQRIESANQMANTYIVDYAHTPDAVIRTLTTARELTRNRVIAVLGCGGDRDRGKRALMGAALNAGSDIPIFTSDNPRSENPAAIIDEMVHGLKLKEQAEIIVDRRQAIRRAIDLAAPGDLVIVLGKGHETGQEIAGVKYPFSDQDEIANALGGSK